MRKGELLALRWMDVDWEVSKIRVRRNYVRGRFGTPKSRRSFRSVPLADEVAGELHRLWQASRYQGDEDLVFAHPLTGETMSTANITRRMKAALEAAGFVDRDYVFHDLRHTFGTRMAAAGVPLISIKEWMGHRDIATTQRYADYMEASNEAEVVSRAFAKAVEEDE
jgi:integrase